MAGRSDIEAGRAFVRLYMRNQEFQSGLRQAKKLLADFADAVKNLGRSMIGLSLGGLVPAGLSVKRYIDFDDALRAIRATTRSTIVDVDKLGEEAKALSVALGYSAKEVANIMLVLARGDFKVAEVEDATRAVLTMARATGTDAVMSAEIFMKTLRQFGLSTKESVALVDKLTLSANRSTISVENLGDSLKYSAAVGTEFKMTNDEVLAMTAGLGNLGIEGEMAGTALRRLMTLITADKANLLKNFGVSAVDATGNMRPLIDVFHDIHSALSKSSIPTMAAKLDDAFGLLGVTPAIGIGRTAISIKELYNDIKTAKNVAETAAKIINGGLGGAFRTLISLVDVLAIEIGKTLNEEIMHLVGVVDHVTTTIVKFVKENKELVVTVAKVSLVIGGTGLALLAFGTAIRFAEYGLTGFLALSTVVLAPLSLFTGELMKAWMGARLFSRGVTQALGHMVARADMYFARFQKVLISFGSVLLRTIGGGAVAAFRNLPSIASSALGGMRTAFLSTAQAAHFFWAGLMGRGGGVAAGIMMNFRGLGASIAALGSVIRANGPALMGFLNLFVPSIVADMIGIPVYLMKAAYAARYFFVALSGARRSLVGLSWVERQFWMLGARANYAARQIGAAMSAAGTRISILARLFTVGLFNMRLSALGLGRVFGSMIPLIIYQRLSRLQRMMLMFGSSMSYIPRRIAAAMTPVAAALGRMANVGRVHMTTFWTALSGKNYHKPVSTFTALERQLWKLGALANYYYVRPFITGSRAIAAVGRQAFLTIGTAAILTSKLTLMAWRVVGPRIAAGLKTSIVGAFRAIRAVSVGTAKGLMGGFGAGVSGLANVFSMLGSYGTGAVATMAGLAGTLALIVPSVLGLLNPMSILTGLIVGGAIGWAKYTESGKKFVNDLTPYLKKFAGIAGLIFGSMKDAFAAGDLELSARIGLTGLRLVFLEAISSLYDVLGPVWGDVLGKLGTDISEGRMKNAWDTSIGVMTASWAAFASGMAKLYVEAIDKIMAAHKRMKEGITNWIVEQASQDSAWGAAMSLAIGSNIQEEAAIARQLEAARQKSTLGAGTKPNLLVPGETGASGPGSGPDLLDKGANIVKGIIAALNPENVKKDLIPKLNKAAEDAKAGVVADTAGGGGTAVLATEKAMKELTALRKESFDKAQAAKRKAEAELAGGQGGGPPILGGGEGPLDEGIGRETKGGTATFSAYAAVASNRSDLVVSKLEETKAAIKAGNAELVKIQGEINQTIRSFLSELRYT